MTFLKSTALTLILSLGLLINQPYASGSDSESEEDARAASPAARPTIRHYLTIPQNEALAAQINRDQSPAKRAQTLITQLQKTLGKEIPHDREALISILEASEVHGKISGRALEPILRGMDIWLTAGAKSAAAEAAHPSRQAPRPHVRQAPAPSSSSEDDDSEEEDARAATPDPITMSQKHLIRLTAKVAEKPTDREKAEAIFHFLSFTEAFKQRFPNRTEAVQGMQPALRGGSSLEDVLHTLGVVIENQDTGGEASSAAASTSALAPIAPRQPASQLKAKQPSTRLADLDQQQEDQPRTISRSITQTAFQALRESVQSYIQTAFTKGSRRVDDVDVLLTPIVMTLDLNEKDTLKVKGILESKVYKTSQVSTVYKKPIERTLLDMLNALKGTHNIQAFYQNELRAVLIEVLKSVDIKLKK